jgi:hypothetical protein
MPSFEDNPIRQSVHLMTMRSSIAFISSSSTLPKGCNSTAKASHLGRDAHEATTPLVLCLCAPEEFGNRPVICPACMGHSGENPLIANGHFSANAGQRL